MCRILGFKKNQDLFTHCQENIHCLFFKNCALFFQWFEFFLCFFLNVPVTQMQTVNEEKSDHRKEKLEEGEVTNCLRIFFMLPLVTH